MSDGIVRRGIQHGPRSLFYRVELFEGEHCSTLDPTPSNNAEWPSADAACGSVQVHEGIGRVAVLTRRVSE